MLVGAPWARGVCVRGGVGVRGGVCVPVRLVCDVPREGIGGLAACAGRVPSVRLRYDSPTKVGQTKSELKRTLEDEIFQNYCM